MNLIIAHIVAFSLILQGILGFSSEIVVISAPTTVISSSTPITVQTAPKPLIRQILAPSTASTVPSTYVPGQHDYITYPIDSPITSTKPVEVFDITKDAAYQKCLADHPQTFGGCYISNTSNNFIP